MAASRLTKAQLEERLAALEAENARLRDDLAAAPSPEPARASGTPGAALADAPRHRGRAFLGATLIVIAAILAPLSTVASYAASQISDTGRFVATLAPLAEDPAIQSLVVDQAAVAIDDALDTDALVADLLDGVFDEDSTPRLAAAADLLGPLLADQTRTAVRSALTAVVESEQFATVWTETLTLTHSQVVAVLEGDGDGALAIDDSGAVVIQLQPILDSLKPYLVEQGFTLAASIPAVDVAITITEVPQIATARLGYAVLTTVGDVLPWTVLGLLVIGVVVHPRRPRAVVLAGSLMLVVGLVVASVLAAVGAIAAATLATDIPTAATRALYDGLTGSVTAAALAFALAGAVALVAGLVAGTSAAAASARRAGAGVGDRLGAWLDARGWRSSDLARALASHRWLLWTALVAVLALCFALLKPLTPWDVALTGVLLALVAGAYGVLSAGSSPEPASDPAVDPV
ncbi:hypothetical protein [Demequina sp. NBRC 110052]|uniref:hypothetical protein n=1 Tax=Demequina sp. NBRC 110052 TaxID=1570341 RepID=UPI0009FD98EA|nr:hypothetical protein [Demequina sp. NBRC 110052]